MRRGFTLIELMVVVAIVGVLSAIAIYGFRKYQLASKASEATGMLAGIRGAQESYKAENLTYVGCTSTTGVTAGANIGASDLYPRALTALNDRKMSWEQADSALTRCFRTLGARSDGPVVYTYGVASRAPGATTAVTLPSAFTTGLATVTLREPFYLAVAYGNRDGDSIYSRAMTTSAQNEVHLEEDTE